MNRMNALPCFLALLGAATVTAADLDVPEDFATLQAALTAAKPGDVIVVQPGCYSERVGVPARVSLRSAGDDARGEIGLVRAEATILDAGGKSPAVVLATGSSIDGLTITNAGVFDQDLFDQHYQERGENLPDEMGAVGLEDSAPAVSVAQGTAKVSHCIIHDNGSAGIGVSGEGNLSKIWDNVVYRNLGGGIGLANGTAADVRGNTCYQNLRGGIGCRASRPHIHENRCSDNVRAGIGIREGATPLVERNECHGNRRAGIGIRMKGTAPVVRGNRCYDNGMAGIGIRNQASPSIQENECFGNRLAGIGATGDAKLTILQNRIYDNGAAAIGLDECREGKAVIRDNEIVAKSLVALGIHRGWTALVEGNQISRQGGMPPLAMVSPGAVALFTGNHFVGSGVAAIRSQGDITVNGNIFHCPAPRKGGPPQFAVWALPGSKVEFGEDNQVSGWRNSLVGP